MAVSKMKKLSVIAMKDETDRLAGRLLKLRCVEVTRLAEEDSPDGLRRLSCADELTPLYEGRRDCEKALKLLEPYSERKKGLFAKKRRLEAERAVTTDTEAALEAARDTIAAAGRITELESEKRGAAIEAERLKPWLSCDASFGETTDTTVTIFGTLPVYTDMNALCGGGADFAAEEISSDAGVKYVCVIARKDEAGKARQALFEYGFVESELTGLGSTAAEETERIMRRTDGIDAEIAKLKESLSRLAEKEEQIEDACDMLGARITAAETKQKLFESENAVYMRGWVPEKAAERVTNELDRMECCYELTEPEEGDDVPVLLVNREALSAFESVIGMYSLPAYGAFDPTLVMSVFYFIIFGLMLGDFVYGLILTVGGFLAVKLLDLGDGVKRLIKLFAICGISCMISGIIFGSYLGDFPKQFCQNMLGIEIGSIALWFDPLSDPVKFLVVSLAVGVVHLLAGLGVKFYVMCITGHPIAAIFDVGSWYVIFLGIGLYFVNPTVGMITAAVGVLMIVFTQGRAEKNPIMKLAKGVIKLYDIVNFVSDLLSYSRIMALGMASAVVAGVINIISTMFGPSVPGFILMVVIIIIGNVVNLAINLLGSFVHTSRLQYIEFFGKFYEDGGRAFEPVCAEGKYNRIE
ncbi:MAG: V-type ATP synthase subunit I [Firmicutes bacterium]|nr:V-type ATP synthase subunit I [Bacillota bacterium]